MVFKSKSSADETHLRAVLKAVSYRLLAALATTTIVFVFTRRILLSLGVGLTELVAKIVFYYVHERVWSKIPWGKKEHPLSSIPVNRELSPEDMEKIKKQLRELGYLD